MTMTATHLFIVFCAVLNGTQCRELEIAPDQGSLTVPQCLRGAMMGNQNRFMWEGIEWQIKGGKCREVPLPLAETQARLRATVE